MSKKRSSKSSQIPIVSGDAKVAVLKSRKTWSRKHSARGHLRPLKTFSNPLRICPSVFFDTLIVRQVLTYIIDEHPQTIALILSYLPPAFAAEVMAGLSPDCQIAVVRRMATMGQTSPEVIREVELGLKKRMSSVVNQSFEPVGGVESVAKLLNDSDRDTERALLEKLESDDPELVQQIRRLMFVFEDIARLDNKDIQAILKNVENMQCSYALKGASDELKDSHSR